MPPPAISSTGVRRLVFVKYLARLASEQAAAPEPLSAAAILTFHDAVELFLQLASEQLNVGAKRLDFMQYFDHIDPTISNSLAQREAMRRLNNARIALKHHGTLPARSEVRAFEDAVGQFFESNTPVVFGLAFASISLSSLVADAQVRECLERSDEHVARAEMSGAMAAVSEAFTRLLNGYSLSSGLAREAERAADELDRAINSPYSRGPAGKMARVIEALADEVALLRHGIDTRRLTLFRSITPNVAVTMDGKAHVTWMGGRATPDRRAVSFCYDFVIDSALRVQAAHTIRDELSAGRYLRSAFGRV